MLIKRKHKDVKHPATPGVLSTNRRDHKKNLSRPRKSSISPYNNEKQITQTINPRKDSCLASKSNKRK